MVEKVIMAVLIVSLYRKHQNFSKGERKTSGGLLYRYFRDSERFAYFQFLFSSFSGNVPVFSPLEHYMAI